MFTWVNLNLLENVKNQKKCSKSVQNFLVTDRR